MLLGALLLSLPAQAQIGPPGASHPGGVTSPMRPLPTPPPLKGPAGSPGNPGPAGGTTTFRPGTSAQGMTASQVRSALQARGYTSLQGLHRSGNIYTGFARRDGRMVPVTIDANTGQVIEP